ncbi:uncharacterized protein P884DRAFT_240302 [Thermothelomyces heterothallicus CBS 202.75]|uniref:uncharacterized protein n=1 Tax=Thermothelomyces heterothallicus CBS 202.75 TaxID=1149848 RepID=UPI0037432D62
MDIPLQWTLSYLKDTLPPDLVIFLGNVRAALLHPSSPVHALRASAIVRRVMLFWTRLAFRMLFWSAAALLASAVWQRGVERSARDAVVAASRLAGWLAGAADLFWHEYEKAREAQARAQAQAQMQYQARGYRMAGPGAGAGAAWGAAGAGWP